MAEPVPPTSWPGELTSAVWSGWNTKLPRENWLPSSLNLCRSYSIPRSMECLPWTMVMVSLTEIVGSVETYGPSVLSPNPSHG